MMKRIRSFDMTNWILWGFVGFLFCLSTGTVNAGPGGVTADLKLWLKADADVFSDAGVTLATDTQNVRQWNDQSGTLTHASQNTSGDQAQYRTSQINFNPAVVFEVSNKEFFDPITFTGFAGSYSVFLVAKSSYTSNGQLAVTSNGGTGTGVHIEFLTSTGKLRFTHRGPASNSGGDSLLDGVRSLTKPEFYSFYRASNTKHKYLINGGSELSLVPTQLGLTSIEATSLYIGKLHSNVKYFEGEMAEIIIFNSDVEGSRGKIESYLAIKYGLTLDQATGQDYLSSAGTVIWDDTTNGVYKHDIAGIARDDASALDQRKSKSEESDDILTLAHGDLSAATAFGADQSFLLWANDNDDNGVVGESTNDLATNVTHRLDREWKVDLSGTVGAVDLEFDLSSVVVTGASASDLALLIDTDNDGDFTTGTISSVVASSFVSNIVTINDATLVDGNVFTLATSIQTTGFTVVQNGGGTSVSEGGTTDTFTVVLDTAPDTDVVIGVSSGDVGEATVSASELTFTSDNWDTAQTVTVTGVDDGTDDGDQVSTITLTVVDGSSDDSFDALADQTVSVMTEDDDEPAFIVTDPGTSVSENGTTDTFTVHLSLHPASNVVLNVSSGDLGEMTVSPSTLTFFAGIATIPQTVTVTGVNDAIVDGDVANLVTISVDDGSSHDSFDALADQTVSVTTEDNDTGSYTIAESGGGTSVSEAGTTDTYTVVLDAEPGSDVVFDVSSDDVGEATVFPVALTFTSANWNTAQTVTVTGANDAVVDGDQSSLATVSINDGSSHDSFDGLADQTVSVTTTDDETAGFTMVESGGGTSVNEVGTTDTFTVVLDAEPGSDVVFDVSSGDVGEATVSPAALTFTSANWETAQTVTVTGADDTGVDRDQTSVVTVSINDGSSDNLFDAVADQTVNVTTVDDEINAGPGGLVTDLKLWLRADADVFSDAGVTAATDTQNIRQWNDQSGTLTHASQNTSGDQAQYRSSQINFNPAVVFEVSNKEFFDPMTFTGFEGSYSVFLVAKSSYTSNGQVAMTSNGGTGTGVHIEFLTSTGKLRFTHRGPASNSGGDTLLDGVRSLTKPEFYSFYRASNTKHKYLINGGSELSLVPTQLGLTSIEATSLYIGKLHSNVKYFEGEMAEIIIFNSDVEGSRGKIESYLAIKYGLTLDQATGQDYLSSAGTVIWDDTTNGGYKQDIAGIGRDDASALDQRKSKSEESDDILTLAHGDLGAATAFGADQSFLFWANDNDDNGVVGELTNELAMNVTHRLDREWKVDLSGTVGAVDLEFDLNSVVVTGTSASDFALLIDTDNDGDFTTGAISSVAAASFASNKVTINDATLSDGNVFTLATSVLSSGFTVAESGGGTSVSEGGTTDTFTVVLDAAPSTDVVIGVSSSDVGEATVLPAELTYTSENWAVAQTVTVTGVDDGIDDGDQASTMTLTVVAGSSDDSYDSLADQTVSVTTVDDEEPAFIVTNPGTSVSENGTTDTFTVHLSLQPGSNVVLDIGSGDLGEMTVSPSTLTYSEGIATIPQTVTVTGVDDAIVDGNVTSLVTISVNDEMSHESFDALADQTVSVITEDNDTGSYTIAESDGTTSVGEGGTSDTFTVVLDVSPASNVVLNVSGSDAGEATASPAELSFTSENWNTAQTVTVTGVDDAIADGDQISTVTVSVNDASSHDGFDALADQTVSVTTTDDEVSGFTIAESGGTTSVGEGGTSDTFTVVLDVSPASNVVLNVSRSDAGEATASPAELSFTSENWNTAQTVTVTGVDDAIADGDQISTVTVSVNDASSDDGFDALADQTVSVTTTDDEVSGFTIAESGGTTSVGEGGTSDTFTVVLDVSPASNVVLNVSRSDAGEATASPAELSFTSENWNTAQTVTVTGVDDAIADGDQISTVTVSVNDASSDDGFDALADQTVSVTTTDDEVSGFTIAESGGTTSVGEGGTTDTFTVVIDTAPVSNVVFDVSSADVGEATASPAQLTFTSENWNTAQTVTVTGVNDSVVDGDQSTPVTISIDIASSHDSFDGLANQTVTITTVDNETAGFTLAEGGGGTSVNEGGTTDTFTVVLDAEPGSDVVLDVSSDDVGEATVSPSALTFTTANWDAAQTVTVTGVDDTVVDREQTSALTVSINDGSSDDLFDVLADQTVNVTTVDDEINAGPGGLATDLKLWLRADADVFSDAGVTAAADTQNIRQWNDQSGTLTHASQDTSGDQAQYRVSQMNFNPTVEFDVSNKEFFDPITFTGFAGSYSVFLVAKSSYTSNGQLALTSNGGTGTGVHIEFLTSTGKLRFTHRGPASNSGGDSLLDGVRSLTKPEFYSFYRASNTKHKYLINGGSELSAVPTQLGLTSTEATSLYIGKLHSNVKYFEGEMAEIIIFNADVEASRGRIESYLAIKYGLTLDQSTGQDYLSSAGTVIWDVATNGSYKHDIAGIGRDDASALDQRKSKSEESDEIVTIAHGDLTTPVGLAVDQSFLLWAGDNDDDGAIEESTNDVPSNVVRRLDREWKVDLSGTVGVVDLEFDLSAVSVTGTTASDFVLLIDTDNDGDFTTGTITRLGASTFASNKVLIDDATLADGNVFALGTSVLVSGFSVAESGGGTSVSETRTTDSFDVTLAAAPTENVVLSITSSDTGEATVSPVELTFTSANWNAAQTVTVTGVDDGTDDGDQSSTITLSVVDANSDDSFDAIADQTVNVTTLDDDEPAFIVTNPGTSVSESGTTDTFTVHISLHPASNVVLNVSSGDVGEMTVSPSSLTFFAGIATIPQTVTVTGVDDAIVDGDITSLVTISVDDANSHDSFDSLDDQTVDVTTTDDETAGLTIAETDGGTSVLEGGTTDTFSVMLSGEPRSSVTIDLLAGDQGEATVSPAALTFTSGNWNVPQTVTVTGVDDSLLDGNQVSTVSLSVNDTASDDLFDGLEDLTVGVTTVDDDTAAFTVTESGGNTRVGEDGSVDTFDVVLNVQPESDVVIDIVSAEIAQATVDLGILTFTMANWNVGQTITVTGVDDSLIDGDVTVELSLSVNAGLSDDNFDGLAEQTLSVTAIDDDVAGFTIAESGGGTVVGEDGSMDDFTVLLDAQPVGDVVLAIVSGDTGEATIDPWAMTFTSGNWNVAQTVTVTGVDDQLGDGNATTLLTVSIITESSDDQFDGVVDQSVEVTTIDNDSVQIVVVESDGLTTVNEDGGSDSFVVSLNAVPVTSVVLQILSADVGEFTVDPIEVTFTQDNWSDPLTIIVAGVLDREKDGDQIVPALVFVADADPGDPFADAEPVELDVIVVDSDIPGFTVEETDGETSVTESGPGFEDTLNVVLHAEPVGDIVIALASDDESVVRVVSGDLLFTSANWFVPQEVLLSGVDDVIVDGNKSASVSLTVDAGVGDELYQALDPIIIEVTTDDDDIAGFVLHQTGGVTEVVEGAGVDNLSLVLSAQPVSEIVFKVTVSESGHIGGFSEVVTFAPEEWNQAKTFGIFGVDDGMIEGPVDLELVFEIDPALSDGAFSGLEPVSVSVRVLDDDAAGFVINHSDGGSEVSEAGGVDSVFVSLESIPSSSVFFSVSLPVNDEVALDITSFSIAPETWNVPVELTFSGLDDSVVDGGQLIEVAVSVIDATTDERFRGLAARSVGVLNEDDESAGFTITESGGSSTLIEGGDSDTLDVVLIDQPSSSVFIGFSVDDAGEISIEGSTVLEFTSGNWDQSQSVRVRGVDDFVIDGEQFVEVRAVVDSELSNELFQGVARQVIPLSVQDNDVGDFLASHTDGTTIVAEGGTGDSINVVLTAQPQRDVVVRGGIGDLSIASFLNGSCFESLTFGPGNWNVPQPFRFLAVPNDAIDGERQTEVTLLVYAPQSDNEFDDAPQQVLQVNVVDDDVAGLVVIETGGHSEVGETGASDRLFVRLGAEPTADVVLEIAGSDPSELEIDSDHRTLEFTPLNWNDLQSVELSGVNDDLIDGDQVVGVSVAVMNSLSDLSFLDLTESIEVVVVDDDHSGVLLSSSADLEVFESGETDSFGISLTAEPQGDVTLVVALAETSSQVRVVSDSRLVFTPSDWEQEQSVHLAAIDDFDLEGDSPFAVVVTVDVAASDPEFSELEQVRLAGIVYDNDVAGFSIQEPDGGTSVSENGTSGSFDVVLTARPVSPVLIQIRNPRFLEIDLVPLELSFSPNRWNQAQSVTLSAIDDFLVTGDREFSLTLDVLEGASDPSFAGVAAQTVGIQIVDDDSPGFELSQTDPEIAVTESGSSATVHLVLSAQPLGPVEFGISSLDVGEVEVHSDSRTLRFTRENWNQQQEILLQGVDDNLLDGDQSVDVRVVIRADESDEAFQGLLPGMIDVSVLDDDVAGFSVSVEEDPVELSESGGQGLILVSLDAQPATNVALTIANSDPSEVMMSPQALIFTPTAWDTPQSVTLIGVDDDLVDGDQLSTVILTVDPVASDSDFSGVAAATVNVRNVDDELADFVLLESDGRTSVVEGGGADTIEVRLTGSPVSPVVLAILSDEPNRVTATPDQLRFDQSDWNQTQTVSVVGLDNHFLATRQEVGLQFSVVESQSDVLFGDVALKEISVLVEDDDLAGFTVTETDGTTSVNETGSTDHFSVSLDVQPTEPVVIAVDSLDLSEMAVSPSRLEITPANWNQAFDVTVTGVDDSVIDGIQVTDVRLAIIDPESDLTFVDVLPQNVSVQTIDDDLSGIRVKGGDIEIVSGDTTPNESDGTSFGGVAAGQESLVRTFIIESIGTGKLTLGGAAISLSGPGAGEFDIVLQPAAVVESGEQSEFTVRYSPQEPGVSQATLSIENDDQTNSPFVFDIAGAGVVGPVGITDGLKLWLKAESGVASDEAGNLALDGDAVYSWIDSSGNEEILFQDTLLDQPAYVEEALNFNAAIALDSSNTEFFDELLLDAFGGDYSIYVVAQALDSIGNYALLNVRDANAQNAIISEFEEGSNAVRFLHRNPPGDLGGDDLTAGERLQNGPNVLGLFRQAGNGHGFSLNGSTLSLDPTKDEFNIGVVDELHVGRLGNDSRHFNGQIAELIVFNTETESSRNRIDSYLALKYGVSLDLGVGESYVDSEGTAVWTASENGDYLNDITGLARDDTSGLAQSKSRSSQPDDIVTIGHGDLVSPVAFGRDRSFLIWSNNDSDELIEETSVEAPDGIHRRLDREWRVSVTGDVGAVDLEFDLSNIQVEGTSASQFFLLLDSDQDGDFTTGSITGIFAAEFINQKVTFNGVLFEDGDLFTLGEIEDGNSLISQGTVFTLSDSPNQVIRDSDPTGSLFEIEVTDLPTQVPVKDINVRLTLSGSRGFNGDIYAYLTRSGSDRFAVLLNRPGKEEGNFFGYSGAGFDGVVFDDAAANGDVHVYETQLASGEDRVALTGSWQPDGRNIDPSLVSSSHARPAMLGNFNGENPNGTWLLYLADLSPGGELLLESWSLEITTESAFTFFGIASDGLIAGGTVFFDANLNGVLDGVEPSALTDNKGRFDLNVLVSTFDRNGDGKLDSSEGELIVQGGTDISTGLPLFTPFSAPLGATVIHPVTTLISELMARDPTLSAEAAELKVENALGLDPDLAARVDLLTFDIFGEVALGNPDAVAILSAVAKVQDTVVQISDLVSGAVQFPREVTAKATVDQMADDILGGRSLALTDLSRVKEIVEQVDNTFGSGLSQGESSAASEIIADGNVLKEEITESGASVAVQSRQLTQSQVQVQSEVAEDLRSLAEGQLNIQDALSKNTSVNLREAVAGAPTGDLTGNELNVGVFGFDRQEYAVTEAGFALNPVTITRVDGNAGSVSLIVTPSVGTADVFDFDQTQIGLLFGPLEIRKTIDASALIRDDFIAEGGETMGLSLSLQAGSAQGAALGNQRDVQITIIDDDTVGTVSFGAGAFIVGESGAQISPITVVRTGGSSGLLPVIVSFHSVANGATDGVDFSSGEVLVEFDNGNLNQLVTAPIINDQLYEGDELLGVSLRLAPNAPPTAILGGVTSAVVTIREDDPIPPPTLSQIADQQLGEDNFLQGLSFTLSDLNFDISQLNVTVGSSNPSLIPNDALVLSGSGAARSLSLRPNSNASGSATITVRADNGTSASEMSFRLSVFPINDPPEIVRLPDIELFSGSGSLLFEYLLGELDSPAEVLETSFESLDPELLPSSSIESVGTGYLRTMRITSPAEGAGEAVVLMTVRDELNVVSQRFRVLIKSQTEPGAPTAPFVLNKIEDIELLEDGQTTIPIVVNLIGELTEAIVFRVEADNADLIDSSRLGVELQDGQRSLLLSPLLDKSGVSNLSVTATSGEHAVTQTFRLSVLPVDDPPVLDPIQMLVIDEDQRGTIILKVTDVDSPKESLRVSRLSSSSLQLLSEASLRVEIVDQGFEIVVSPLSDQAGLAEVTIEVADGSQTVETRFDVQVNPVNDPPFIEEISELSVREGTELNIPLVIGDVDSPSDSLVLSIDSEDKNLLPIANLDLLGEGLQRQLVISPPLGQFGNGVIVLTLSDGSLSSEKRVIVNVLEINDPPFLGEISPITLLEDTEATIEFDFGDPDSPLDGLILSAVAANTELFPAGSLFLDVDTSKGSLRLKPAADENGSSNVTLTVSDGVTSIRREILIAVVGVNDAPQVEHINDIVVQHGEETVVPFRLIDPDNDADELLVDLATTNSELILVQEINVRGETDQREFTLKLADGQSGTGEIIVGVSDGERSSVARFLVTVLPSMTPPVVGIPARLQLERIGKNIVIRWDTNAVLQGASTIGGPYETIAGATSPHVIDPTESDQKFFLAVAEKETTVEELGLISIELGANGMIVRWGSNAVLERSNSVEGAFEEVVGATSPYLINPAIDGISSYFRLKNR